MKVIPCFIISLEIEKEDSLYSEQVDFIKIKKIIETHLISSYYNGNKPKQILLIKHIEEEINKIIRKYTYICGILNPIDFNNFSQEIRKFINSNSKIMEYQQEEKFKINIKKLLTISNYYKFKYLFTEKQIENLQRKYNYNEMRENRKFITYLQNLCVFFMEIEKENSIRKKINDRRRLKINNKRII